MNMYQKREARKNKPEEIENKTNINWDNPTDRKPHSNLYEMGIFEK